MTTTQKADDIAARLILKQAELVALEVARVEVIVNNALGAAAMALAATGITDSPEITESAKDTLQVARGAAAKVLQVAKKEAERTLQLAKSLANARLVEADVKLVTIAPILDCS
jgi:glycerol kinase